MEDVTLFALLASFAYLAYFASSPFILTGMTADLPHTLLGRSVDSQPAYSPAILMPIARALTRASLGIGEAQALPFVGSDRWTGYELSWLEPGGKPRVAVMRAVIPAYSPQLIESKSLKLYLNSYAREHFVDANAVAQRIRGDLSAAARASVAVEILEPPQWARMSPQELPGECIDELPLGVVHDGALHPEVLACNPGQQVEESLYSHLLKSNCPVTGQPDWGSVLVQYRGARIERAGLLRYLLSFREVCEFHEHCVERIFVDLTARCAPASLSVEARYTRRGGLDINPYRASGGAPVSRDRRQIRQ